MTGGGEVMEGGRGMLGGVGGDREGEMRDEGRRKKGIRREKEGGSKEGEVRRIEKKSVGREMGGGMRREG